jgi:predicted nucleic acid-binding protein
VTSTRYLQSAIEKDLPVPGAYVELKAVPTDPDDDMVVVCAVEGGADYLVTDDRRDLLPLKVIRMSGYRPVQVTQSLSNGDRLLGEPPFRHR